MDTFGAIEDLVNDAAIQVFSRSFTHNPAAGGSHAAVGVWDEKSEQVEMQDGVPVSAVRPMMQVELKKMVVQPVQGDGFTIDARVFRVNDIQPDGRGWAKVFLIDES